MRKAPLLISFYSQTFEEVMDVIYERRLQGCEPVGRPYLGVRFPNENLLLLFVLRFDQELWNVDDQALIPPDMIGEVEEFFSDTMMGDDIDRCDLTAVEFWDAKAKRVLDESLALQ